MLPAFSKLFEKLLQYSLLRLNILQKSTNPNRNCILFAQNYYYHYSEANSGDILLYVYCIYLWFYFFFQERAADMDELAALRRSKLEQCVSLTTFQNDAAQVT